METEIKSPTRLSSFVPLIQKATQYKSADTGLKITDAIISDTRCDRPDFAVCENDSAANNGVNPAAIGSRSVRTAKAMICMIDPAKATPAKANIRIGPPIDSLSCADPSTDSALDAPKLSMIQSESRSEATTAPTTKGGMRVPKSK
ncbi:hypothetical protein NQ042_12655 [Corynebacterium phoceense]|nr:hypothetical protein [Corynebacterium phoceense]